MPFDPTIPVENSEMRSEEMRDQFNGLKDLIDQKLDAPETDPVFGASEARLFVPGDKAKLDAAASVAYVDSRSGGPLVTPFPPAVNEVVQPSPAHDVLVLLWVHCNATGVTTIKIGDTNPPGAAYGAFNPGTVADTMLCFPVPRGQYFQVAGNAANVAVYNVAYLNLNL